MSNSDNIATWADYKNFIKENLAKIKEFPHPLEWSYAIGVGWDEVEYNSLYFKYVESTQIVLNPKDDATELKARPMEKICRYFLKKGGVVTNINEISVPGKWQVDGQGPLNKSAIFDCFGSNFQQQSGFQLYMEAKNHSDPVSGNEFSAHFRRMEEHECNVGVFFSTSGYKFKYGKGFAESIHHNFLRNRYHFLLTFCSMKEILENKPPLVILQEALCNAANENYSKNKKIQFLYSKEYCQEVAIREYKRLLQIA